MSIVTEIERLQAAKDSIKTALAAKNIDVGDGTLDTFAPKIDELQLITDATRFFYQSSRANTVDEFNNSVKLLGKITNGKDIFRDFYKNLSDYDITQIDFSECTSLTYGFAGMRDTEYVLPAIDTSKCTNFNEIFALSSSLKKLDISNLNMDSATNVSLLTYNDTSLTELILGNWTLSNVTLMNQMFVNNKFTSINTSCWSNNIVTNLSNAFRDCSNLIELDLSGLSTSNCIHMSDMFNGCRALTKLILGNFDMSNATSYSNMFNNCTVLDTIIINNPTVISLCDPNLLDTTGIGLGTGYVYVPDELVDAYIADETWVNYIDRIKGISELTAELSTTEVETLGEILGDETSSEEITYDMTIGETNEVLDTIIGG